MLFTADVQCVFCGSEIKFFGSTILYENNVCASHNKEHKFPGINVLVDKTSNPQTASTNLISNIDNMSSIRHYKRFARTTATRIQVEPVDKVQHKIALNHKMTEVSQFDSRMIHVKPKSENNMFGK